MYRIAVPLLAAIVALTWHAEARAFGCQASATFPLAPSLGATCPTALRVGDTVDVVITANNHSSSVPPGTNVSAKVVNTCFGGLNAGAACTLASECASGVCAPALEHRLACTSTTCATELPNVLTFVPVGANGCVASVAGIASCAASLANPNLVEIRADAEGVALAAGAAGHALATIRVLVTAPLPALPDPCNPFGMSVRLGANSVVTTDAQCDATATGGGAGSITVQMAPSAACAPAPRSGCREPIAPMESRLTLEDRAVDARDRLKWRWTRGAATAKADFGDPLATTGYRLCVYDETAATPSLVSTAEVPAGGTCGTRPCWEETKRGFVYADKAGTPAGVVRLELREGASGKAAITLEARGADVAMPALPLAQDPAVSVQLQNADGGCWGARYTAPAQANDPTEFRERSD